MKKIISMLLFVLLILAACNSSDQKTENSTQNADSLNAKNSFPTENSIECQKIARKFLGDELTIAYGGYVGEAMSTMEVYFLDIEYKSSNLTSGERKENINRRYDVKKDFNWGEQIKKQSSDKIYGSYLEKREILFHRIADPSGTEHGDIHFMYVLDVPDLSTAYDNNYKVEEEKQEGDKKYIRATLTFQIDEIIDFQFCQIV